MSALLPAVLCWYACGLARDAFVCAPAAASPRGLAAGRLRSAAGGTRTARGFMGNPFQEDDGRTSEQKERDELEAFLYPPEKMWQLSDDGMRLREIYPGARDFFSVFWAIVQPAASFGFLIVGLSSNESIGNIVDWTPITSKYLYFLRPVEGIYWVPQGIAMTFYGFFGFFLFGPLQWWLNTTNQGEGFAEFDKKTRRLVVVRNDELLKDMSWDDIDKVVLEWTDLAFGDREVSLVDLDGNKITVMNKVEDLPKRILERRAAILSEFIGKELEVEDA